MSPEQLGAYQVGDLTFHGIDIIYIYICSMPISSVACKPLDLVGMFLVTTIVTAWYFDASGGLLEMLVYPWRW